MTAELRRLMRHQRHIIERDSAKGVLHYGSEEELYKMSPCGQLKLYKFAMKKLLGAEKVETELVNYQTEGSL